MKAKKFLDPNRENVEKAFSVYSPENVERAKRSGIALRVITAKSAGVYPVDFSGTKKAGTPVIISFLYRENGGTEKGSLPAGIIGKALSSLDFSSPEGKKLSSLLPPGYANFKTLRSRILSEVNRGAIRSFSPVK